MGSKYDLAVIAPGDDSIAHIEVVDVEDVVQTACGLSTFDMTQEWLYDDVPLAKRCPVCFPSTGNRYPQDTCSACGDIVSLRPEKIPSRQCRPGGGWDHSVTACPSMRPSHGTLSPDTVRA